MRLQHQHAAEPVEHGAAEHAGGGHGDGEHREDRGADGGVVAVSVDDGEGEPVVRAALGERHAEHDDADEQQAHVGPDREALAQALRPRHAWRVGVRVVAELLAHGHESHRDDHGDGHEHGHDAEVERDRDAERGCRGRDARAGDRAEAEEGVHERHHRLAELPLGLGALDVHHHVDRAVAEPEQREADRRRAATDGAIEPPMPTSTRPTATVMSTPAMPRRAPNRAMSQGAAMRPRIEAIDPARMTRPTPCVLSPTSSRIAGRRATQLARLSPERKKIVKIALRQATSSRRVVRRSVVALCDDGSSSRCC